MNHLKAENNISIEVFKKNYKKIFYFNFKYIIIKRMLFLCNNLLYLLLL